MAVQALTMDVSPPQGLPPSVPQDALAQNVLRGEDRMR
jgi:hypothetical protein